MANADSKAMQLPAAQFARKVITPFQVNLAVTLLVGFITRSPLAAQPWLQWLTDPAVAAAMITLISFAVGYQVTETAYNER